MRSLLWILISMVLFSGIVRGDDLLKMNDHFLLAPDNGTNYEKWLARAKEYAITERKKAGQEGGFAIYERDDLSWMKQNYTSRMVMMYGLDFYDEKENSFNVDSLVTDGIREFGGYDSVILWHGYPRLGIDERNQFDFYRRMPGGLAGLRKVVQQFHSYGIKVFVDYNPWDTGTRREGKSDFELIAELVKAIDADGVFLDTMSASSDQLRKQLDAVKKGVGVVCEGHPSVEQLSHCGGSWGQWLDYPDYLEKPGLLKLGWIEQGHIQHQVRRWDRSRRDEIKVAFFNASGMLIWENVFGTYNPWSREDRRCWEKANRILHYFSDVYRQGEFKPFFPSGSGYVYVNLWEKDGVRVYNYIEPVQNRSAGVTFFFTGSSQDKVFYDVWNGGEIHAKHRENGYFLRCPHGSGVGCIVEMKNEDVDKKFLAFLNQMKGRKTYHLSQTDFRNHRQDDRYAYPFKFTKMMDKDDAPKEMVYVPGGVFYMQINHVRGECGCYGSSINWDDYEGGFGYGLREDAEYPRVIHSNMQHHFGKVEVEAFLMDKTEVTNLQFHKFLQETGYRPRFDDHFLHHWPGGKMPKELADHPVVYVNLDDARAYAKWAGKRLPTEDQWQFAAQGTDGRKWPWGNEYDDEKCNGRGSGTRAVGSYENGKSPFGCYDMAGNVWEMTESYRSDGHTRYYMIRGGSYFKVEGSIWYIKGGARQCNSHEKFICISPGQDRCSTVGFRCVIDAKETLGLFRDEDTAEVYVPPGF